MAYIEFLFEEPKKDLDIPAPQIEGNDTLRQALNWALFRVWEKGKYTDLWLRYFSVSPF